MDLLCLCGDMTRHEPQTHGKAQACSLSPREFSSCDLVFPFRRILGSSCRGLAASMPPCVAASMPFTASAGARHAFPGGLRYVTLPTPSIMSDAGAPGCLSSLHGGDLLCRATKEGDFHALLLRSSSRRSLPVAIDTLDGKFECTRSKQKYRRRKLEFRSSQESIILPEENRLGLRFGLCARCFDSVYVNVVIRR